MAPAARWLSALVLAGSLGAAFAEAQVIALPPVEPAPPAFPPSFQAPGWEPFRPDAPIPNLAIENEEAAVVPAANLEVEDGLPSPYPSSLAPQQPLDPDRPPDARDGMFQKLIFTSAYFDAGGSDGLGITELDLSAVLALPIPSRKAPLLVIPGFNTYFLQWPRSPDLPSQVYDAYLQFRWMCRISPALATDLSISPGVYSDFKQGSDEAIRLPGYGAALWTWSPQWQALLGCAYLDRLETNILPIGGLIWTPNDDLKFDILFPKPKLAYRIRCSGAATREVQDWVYLSGDFGSNNWAVRRAGGADDVLDYRDWRILLGAERKAIGALDYYCELGYIFNRQFEYGSSRLEYEPSDTFMIRIGALY